MGVSNTIVLSPLSNSPPATIVLTIYVSLDTSAGHEMGFSVNVLFRPQLWSNLLSGVILRMIIKNLILRIIIKNLKDTSRGQIETDSVRRRMVFPPVIDDHCSAFPLCRQIMTGEKDPKQPRLVG